MQFLQNLFERGGPLMWPLLGCSMIAVTVVLERCVFWLALRLRVNRSAVERVFELTEARRYADALEVRRVGRDPVGAVLLAGLRHRHHGLSEAMQVEAETQVDRMKQGLSILDTIVTLAPLLGILGTVSGIIESFELLGTSGIEDPQAVTGGIAEALITTAAGLAVAIVTLIPLNTFMARLQREARRLQQTATQFEVAYRRSRQPEACD
jgi:biopolymer transport protein ExbB